MAVIGTGSMVFVDTRPLNASTLQVKKGFTLNSLIFKVSTGDIIFKKYSKNYHILLKVMLKVPLLILFY